MSNMEFMRPNVIYTILLGVLSIHIRRSTYIKNPVIKTLLILMLTILCVPADWGCTGMMIIIVLDYFYGNFKNQAFAYCLIVLPRPQSLSRTVPETARDFPPPLCIFSLVTQAPLWYNINKSPPCGAAYKTCRRFSSKAPAVVS